MNENEKLVSFFYILLRDHLTFGEVESIFKQHVDIVPEGIARSYSCPIMEQKSRELTERILDE